MKRRRSSVEANEPAAKRARDSQGSIGHAPNTAISSLTNQQLLRELVYGKNANIAHLRFVELKLFNVDSHYRNKAARQQAIMYGAQRHILDRSVLEELTENLRAHSSEKDHERSKGMLANRKWFSIVDRAWDMVVSLMSYVDKGSGHGSWLVAGYKGGEFTCRIMSDMWPVGVSRANVEKLPSEPVVHVPASASSSYDEWGRAFDRDAQYAEVTWLQARVEKPRLPHLPHRTRSDPSTVRTPHGSNVALVGKEMRLEAAFEPEIFVDAGHGENLRFAPTCLGRPRELRFQLAIQITYRHNEAQHVADCHGHGPIGLPVCGSDNRTGIFACHASVDIPLSYQLTTRNVVQHVLRSSRLVSSEPLLRIIADYVPLVWGVDARTIVSVRRQRHGTPKHHAHGTSKHRHAHGTPKHRNAQQHGAMVVEAASAMGNSESDGDDTGHDAGSERPSVRRQRARSASPEEYQFNHGQDDEGDDETRDDDAEGKKSERKRDTSSMATGDDDDSDFDDDEREMIVPSAQSSSSSSSSSSMVRAASAPSSEICQRCKHRATTARGVYQWTTPVQGYFCVACAK